MELSRRCAGGNADYINRTVEKRLPQQIYISSCLSDIAAIVILIGHVRMISCDTEGTITMKKTILMMMKCRS